MQPDQRKKSSVDVDFFTEYGEGSRYKIEEVIGKGSYGVVCSAYDTHVGEKVAIKKINDIFEHVSDATRILREIKLLRILRHPDIVEIKHILLPSSRREFKDIYVVFELMESDLHQVIKANDDLTPEHYQFFLYQLLRGLKYIHTANVFHRDLKPKNILANADCKLKICDFGLARVAFNDTPTAIFWTDYVATRWYRAPELCGSFFSKYTPAIDIWSIGCIFAELLTGKPLFPGKNVVHQLDLMTDLLGTPSPEAIARVRNEKARRYLSSMRKKKPIPFSQKFHNADPLALRLLERMLAFEPKDRPTAEEALADPYFKGLAKVEREPTAQPVTKMEFEFERRRITKEDVKELRKNMSGFVRAKRVTDPLDDKAKARLVGTQLSYVSSGSEHSADDDDDLPCLSELVHGFLENDDSDLTHESVIGHESDSDRVDSVIDCTEFVEDILRSGGNKDSYRNLLSAHVSKAMEAFSCLRYQRPVLRRKVMSFLRELGHNAAICKTKWESSGGLTAGGYEFIDVVQSKSSTLQNRYVVDLDFASQFEIARPTSQFLKLLHSLPRVFVGRSEDLKTIARSISDAAKRSLKSRELSLPPWRKNRYMQNKWFGPYRRTVNPSPETTPSVDGVKCRRVGFDDAVNGRLFVRTR